MKRDDIVKFLDTYLEIHAVEDISWNGLIVEGSDDVRKIILTTDTGISTIKRALDYDLMVVHHGLFWKKVSPAITGVMKERVALLLKNNVSMYAAHLPLDKHHEVGNNVMIAGLLNASVISDFFGVGVIAQADCKLSDVINRLKPLKTLDFGPKNIKKIAICSGAVSHAAFDEALMHKVDLFITGEPIEIYHDAKDNAVNVIFAGHHFTETFGLMALAEVIEKRLGIPCDFMDYPTGL